MNGDTSRRESGNARMKYGMWACCALMLVPVVWYFTAGGADGGLVQSFVAFAPLLLCVGAHFLMHRVTGKSCHGESHDARREDKQVADARRGGTARAMD